MDNWREFTKLFIPLGFAVLVLACSSLDPGISQTDSTTATPPPSVSASRTAGNVTINYVGADVDEAEARWKSKNVDTYQIQVWTGGYTPPPPVYLIQVWKDQVVYAHAYYDGDRYRTPEARLLTTSDALAQSVTVPGLFTTARKLLADTGTRYPGMAKKIQVEFDSTWGYPRSMNSSMTNCVDCAWTSQVREFVPLDPARKPPTPTARPAPTPSVSRP